MRTAALSPADRVAGFFVADRSDGAGVDDIGVGWPVEGHQDMAPGGQLLLHGGSLVLIDLTAQGIDGDIHGISPCQIGSFDLL